MMIVGYMDESISGENPALSFGLSCVFAYGSQWTWAELAWKKLIEEKNRELIKANRKPIRRFHAVDLNNFVEDFEDWSPDERTDFVSEIVKKVFGRHELFSTGFTVSLQDIEQVWPESRNSAKSSAYYVLTKLIMISIADVVQDIFPPGIRVRLIYERCPFGSAMLDAFNSAIDDPKRPLGHIFTALAPMGWEDCIPLQPADFLAYEVMKESHRLRPEVKVVKERQRRGSLNALLSSPNFYGNATNVSRENLMQIRVNISKRIAAKISAPPE
jgi:hypothetical protein